MYSPNRNEVRRLAHFGRQPEPYVLGHARQRRHVHCAEAAQPRQHALHQQLRCGGAGGQPDGRDAVEPLGLQAGRVVDQVAGPSQLLPDLPQAVGVGAVLGPDHQDDVNNGCQVPHRLLPVLGGIADVPHVRPGDGGETLLQRGDDAARVIDRERGLRHVGQRQGVCDVEGRHVPHGLHQVNAAVDLADGALDLGMPGMADQHDLAALGGVAAALGVDLGDQRAGGVDHREAAVGRDLFHRAGDAVRAEDRHGAGRHLAQLVDEHGAPLAQALDDVPVVHDLVTDVDGRSELGQGPLDDLDRALHARAEAAGLREDDPHPTPVRLASLEYSRVSSVPPWHRRPRQTIRAVASLHHWPGDLLPRYRTCLRKSRPSCVGRVGVFVGLPYVPSRALEEAGHQASRKGVICAYGAACRLIWFRGRSPTRSLPPWPRLPGRPKQRSPS